MNDNWIGVTSTTFTSEVGVNAFAKVLGSSERDDARRNEDRKRVKCWF